MKETRLQGFAVESRVVSLVIMTLVMSTWPPCVCYYFPLFFCTLNDFAHLTPQNYFFFYLRFCFFTFFDSSLVIRFTPTFLVLTFFLSLLSSRFISLSFQYFLFHFLSPPFLFSSWFICIQPSLSSLLPPFFRYVISTLSRVARVPYRGIPSTHNCRAIIPSKFIVITQMV